MKQENIIFLNFFDTKYMRMNTSQLFDNIKQLLLIFQSDNNIEAYQYYVE